MSLIQLLGNLQDHTIFCFNYYFYLTYHLNKLCVRVRVRVYVCVCRGVCHGTYVHMWRTRTVWVVGSLPPPFYLYMSPGDQTEVVRFAV